MLSYLLAFFMRHATETVNGPRVDSPRPGSVVVPLVADCMPEVRRLQELSKCGIHLTKFVMLAEPAQKSIARQDKILGIAFGDAYEIMTWIITACTVAVWGGVLILAYWGLFLLFTALLIVEGVVIVALKRRQLVPDKVLQRANDAALYISQRAYLGVENMQITAFEVGKRFAFTFNVQNRGHTPAYNVRIAIRRMDVALSGNEAPRNPDLVLKELAKGAWAESMASHLILPGHPSTANSDETEIVSKKSYSQWAAGRLERWIGVQVKFTDTRGDKDRSAIFLNVYSKKNGLTLVKSYTSDTANIISRPA